MARFVSRRSPVSIGALKRRPVGAVALHYTGWEHVKFTRTAGGWLRERTDVLWVKPEVVSSAEVAVEVNNALGCKESWAKIY